MANKNKKRQQQQQKNNGSSTHSDSDNLAPTMTTTSTTTTNGNSSSPIDDSPLRSFGEAKAKINELYTRIGDCVTKASRFYSDHQLDSEILKNVDAERLKSLNNTIDIIRSVLSRNQMKVAFFGRCANGKSTVINAILHDKVLPVGIGHTTACFLQVQGDQNNEAFLEVQANEKMPIDALDNIANAINEEDCLDCSTLVKIHWPIAKCPLLKYDVVLVDSPGVDAAKYSDQWIDKHCHDADVFVFVSNATSTFGVAEENFFRKVSEKISKPNIFMLNNQWDIAAAREPLKLDKLRKQFIEKAVNILSSELKISSDEEVKQRTFFVSAAETLQERSKLTQNQSGDNGRLSLEFDKRLDEFKLFERRFEESLSKSAIKTKFMKHADKGRETINELAAIMYTTQSIVKQESHRKSLELQHYEDLHTSIFSLFYANEGGLRQRIHEIKNQVQIATESEFENEVKRLSRIVDDFETKFTLESIEMYKEQLYTFVEASLRENLKFKINNVISKHVNPFNKVMYDISLLLSKERQETIAKVVSSQSYTNDDLFDLRICKHFCTEFKEDLEFRFSLGIFRIINKVRSIFSPNVKDQPEDLYSASNTDFASTLLRFAVNPPQSPVTVISLTVGGLLVRFVSIKVITVMSVVYGSLYAYEYLTWTNSAKERAFKTQYVKYARKGLKVCVPIISENVSDSIEQKMITTFSRVKDEVDSENTMITSKISLLRSSLDKLRICDEFTRDLLGENNFLLSELAAFAASFLS